MAKSLLRRGQRGVAVVETAITLIPFLVLLFGVIEAGWFFYVQVTLNNAAREGAKLATRPISQGNAMLTQGDIQTYVNDFLRPIGYNCPGCTTVTDETVGGQTRRRVHVQISYTLITLSMFTPLSFDLKGESVMRNETSPK
jgi:Flp pilus assembly protein TadG